MCTVAVHTGVTEAAICLGLAVGMVETLRTHTPKAIHLVDTRSTVVARAGCTFVNVRITAWACKSRFAGTVVAINAINTIPMNAWVTGTVIEVIFTVYS